MNQPKTSVRVALLPISLQTARILSKIESSITAGNMTSSTGNTHILVIPYPAQGHLIPLLDLTHQLLLRGITATVVVTPNNLNPLQPLLSGHPSTALATLVLPFPSHPSLPAGVENLKDLPPDSSLAVMAALRSHRKPLLRWFASHPSPPSAIISDMFLGWTHHLAVQLSIKRFVFSPSGALALSVMHSLWKHEPALPVNENAAVSFDDIPGKPCFECYQVSGFYKSYSSGVPEAQFLRAQFLDNVESWGFVFNTFTGLERAYLAHMKRDLGHDRIWAVGQISELGHKYEVEVEVEVGLGQIKGEVLTWLDKCGDGEVVYVCFGSQTFLTNEQMEVLAFGLERSGVRFVWKIKEISNGLVDGESLGKLPSGFVDRVAGRGLVIRGWAPQVLILRHRAVGAFLTHCGWNSILEGLSAGVVMLTWPLGADQYSDAVLVVDQLKVGVRAGQGTKSLPDPDELGRILTGSVTGACKEPRLRAMELKKMAKDAISEGGSSLKELDGFVQHLSLLSKPDADVTRDCEKWVEEQEVASGIQHQLFTSITDQPTSIKAES